jgi:hypothetical protein
MMRFVATGIVLWVSLSLLCAGIVSASQSPSKPRQIAGFDTCDNVPCYQGIIPLKTTFENAKIIIARLPGATLSNSDEASLPDGPIQNVRILPSSDGRLREVDLIPRGNAISLGHVISRLGTPCAVYPVEPNAWLPSIIIVAYPTVVFWIKTSNWQLDPSLPVSDIVLVPPNVENFITLDHPISPCEGIKTGHWQGFRRYPY